MLRAFRSSVAVRSQAGGGRADNVAENTCLGRQMKKLLPLAAVFVSIASAASAADFPVAPPMKAALPAPILFSWTGCYVGVEGGGAWGQGEQIANNGNFPNQTITGGLTIKGGIAGGTVGCN